MKRISNLLICGFIFVLYQQFFTSTPLVGGDWPYLYPQAARDFSFFPTLYRSYIWLGSSALPIGGIETYYQITGKLFATVLPWSLTERLFWFIPYLFLAITSSYFLTRSMFAAFLYTTNTYILMTVGGGQLGVALAYALFPSAIKLGVDSLSFEKSAFAIKRFLVLGLVFSVILLVDIRIAYLSAFVFLLWILWQGVMIHFEQGVPYGAHLFTKMSVSLLRVIGILSLSFLLNGFWIIPLFLTGQTEIIKNYGQEYINADTVRFLSFAHFSDSFSLLHPNWPENLFGKVSFLRPEFLFIPLAAFASLLFLVGRQKDGSIGNFGRFMIMLACFGAFLAKGANEPFGMVYLWLFEYIPGFVMFRDPTKFYVFIALAYSVLIPYTLGAFSYKLEEFRKIRFIRTVVYGTFLVFWLYLLMPLWQGNITGIFVKRSIPQEYVVLTHVLEKDEQFSRILWIPQRDSFSYFSNTHPAIDSNGFLQLPDEKRSIAWLEKKENQQLLYNWAVKYIIVPTDTEGKIFVTDRMYDQKKRNDLIAGLDRNTGLQKQSIENSGALAIYKTSQEVSHFWIAEKESDTVIPLAATSIYETEYLLDIPSGEAERTLFFSEMYTPQWQLHIGDTIIPPKKAKGNILAYTLKKEMSGKVQLIHTQQKIVLPSLILSAIALLCILSVLVRRR